MQLLLPIIDHDAKQVAVAASGLAAFVKAIEERVVKALQRVLTALMDTVRQPSMNRYTRTTMLDLQIPGRKDVDHRATPQRLPSSQGGGDR